MTDNLSTKGFAELLEFPTLVTFKFIGTNCPELEKNVQEFFTTHYDLNCETSIGNVSKKGTYITINVKVLVATAAMMDEIYAKGPTIPKVLRVL